jgi:hypothetical protein
MVCIHNSERVMSATVSVLHRSSPRLCDLFDVNRLIQIVRFGSMTLLVPRCQLGSCAQLV